MKMGRPVPVSGEPVPVGKPVPVPVPIGRVPLLGAGNGGADEEGKEGRELPPSPTLGAVTVTV